MESRAGRKRKQSIALLIEPCEHSFIYERDKRLERSCGRRPWLRLVSFVSCALVLLRPEAVRTQGGCFKARVLVMCGGVMVRSLIKQSEREFAALPKQIPTGFFVSGKSLTMMRYSIVGGQIPLPLQLSVGLRGPADSTKHLFAQKIVTLFMFFSFLFFSF